MEKIKVFVVDDSILVWEMLMFALFNQEHIDLIGFATNGKEALSTIDNAAVKPDVVIMDLVMPVMGGIKATEELNQFFPDIKVIILTNIQNYKTADCALRLGARGYITKTNINEKILAESIHTVHNGYAFIESEQIRNLIRESRYKSFTAQQQNEIPLESDSKLPKIFWLIVFIGLINSVSFTIVIPLIYPYAKQFALSDFQASLLIAVFPLSQFFGTPVLGKLSDRLGRKHILVLSLIGTVGANLLASIAGVPWLLYLCRIIDGLTGGSNSVATAVISDITNPKQRAKAIGIFGATFRLGFVVGPLLSYLTQQLPTIPKVTPLGMSFFVSAAIAALGALLTICFLPETNVQRQKFELNWADFAFGKVLSSLGRPKVGKFFILTYLSGLSFTIFTFAFQPFFLNVLGRDTKELAVVFASVGVLGFLSQVFALEILRKNFNLVDIIAVTLLVRGVTFLLLPAFPTYQGFVIITIAFGLVNSFPMPLIDTILSLTAEEQDRGQVLGINSAYFSMSGAIGPVVSGLLLSVNYSFPFWITGAFTLGAAIFALSLKSSLVAKP